MCVCVCVGGGWCCSTLWYGEGEGFTERAAKDAGYTVFVGISIFDTQFEINDHDSKAIIIDLLTQRFTLKRRIKNDKDNDNNNNNNNNNKEIMDNE